MSFSTLAGPGAAQLMCSSVSVHAHGHSAESDDVAEIIRAKGNRVEHRDDDEDDEAGPQTSGME